jgi:predicted PurR-regulated permease PerM
MAADPPRIRSSRAPPGAATPDAVAPGPVAPGPVAPGPSAARESRSLRIAAVVLAICAVIFMLEYAQAVLVPLTLAVLLAMLLSPVVHRLHRWHVPRPVAAGLAVLVSVGGILVLLDRLGQPAAEWLARVPQAMNRAQWVFRSTIGTIKDVQETTEKVARMSGDGGGDKAQQVVVEGQSLAGMLVSGTGDVLVTLGLMLVLLYFMLLSGDLLLRKAVYVLPGFQRKRLMVRIAVALRHEVSRYLLTITAINIGLGVCTAGALYLLGMPDPVLWGALAAVLNFMPYIGAIVSASAIFLASLLTWTDPLGVLLPPAVFLSLTTLEGNFVSPSILGRRLALNPIAVFLFLTVWGWVWGMAGMLIAVPLLVSVKIVAERVRGLYVLSEFLSPIRPDSRIPQRRRPLRPSQETLQREETERERARSA